MSTLSTLNVCADPGAGIIAPAATTRQALSRRVFINVPRKLSGFSTGTVYRGGQLWRENRLTPALTVVPGGAGARHVEHLPAFRAPPVGVGVRNFGPRHHGWRGTGGAGWGPRPFRRW